MNKEKVALITSGGGMKCAYGAGALVALATKLGITEPDIFISASGSVGGMFYYLAKQYDDIERIWLRYMTSPQIVSLVPPKLDVDYLVDTILKEEIPLNIEALDTTKTKWFVPVTNFETGHTRYVSNDTWFDPYEIMRAAKAIPLLYGGAVHLGQKSYIDGAVNANMADLIHKAREEGATKIICIANSTRSSSGVEWLLRRYASFTSPMMKQLLLKEVIRTQWDHLPSDAEILVIGPSYPLPIGLFSRVRRKVAEAYQMGHDDLVEKRPEIEKLLSIHDPA